MEIHPLAPTHSRVAASLHIAGQPGTFLTSLGLDVLSVLYSALPQSSVGFGYVAVPTRDVAARSESSPCGFISATTSVGQLFVEMGTKQFVQFVPPLMRAFVRQPQLAVRSLQTLLYPLLSRNSHAEQSNTPHTANQHAANQHAANQGEQIAELLSIMVEPTLRSQGIGAMLIAQLVAECQRREVAWLDVTVDAHNQGAQRFYRRHGFQHHHDFQLYGRPMCGYRRRVDDSE